MPACISVTKMSYLGNDNNNDNKTITNATQHADHREANQISAPKLAYDISN